MQVNPTSFDVPRFPDTRYMGSKRELLDSIWDVIRQHNCQTILDAFSGSGCVGYMLKTHGKSVIANDYLEYCYHISNATIANNHERLDKKDIESILKPNRHRKRFIQKTFKGLYFSDEENKFLDNISSNIPKLNSKLKRSIAISAISRACLKKRPRGIFTYVGHRYDDGRKDLRISLRDHFLLAVGAFNNAVFDNKRQNYAYNEDIFDLDIPPPDLVYIDPPYVTPHSDNDYLRRYHFLEGLSSYWQGKRIYILKHTKTKKLKKYPTPFDSKATVYDAFETLFSKFSKSKLVVSYSSNSLPTKSEMHKILKNQKRTVNIKKIPHRYSMGTYKHKIDNPTNIVEEYLFIAT